MTLQKIEERFTLWPEWLRYWLDQRYQYNIILDTMAFRGSPEYIMKLYEKTGWMIIGSHELIPEPLNFDQWLYQNNHQDLVLYSV